MGVSEKSVYLFWEVPRIRLQYIGVYIGVPSSVVLPHEKIRVWV